MNILKHIDLKELIRLFTSSYDKEAVETWIIKEFEKRIDILGATFARNIESLDIFYHTAKIGIFKDKKLPYFAKKNRLIGYVLDTGKPIIVNNTKDFPKSIYPHGEWQPYERYMFVPIGIREDLFTHQRYTYGAVVLYRENHDFTEKEKEIATLLGKDTGEILDSYLKIKTLEKLNLLLIEGRKLNMKTLKGEDSIGNIIREFLNLAIELIDAAEKGSALIETPRGMKFIAAIGYDEEKLLSMPPFPAHISKLTWYGLGEENLIKGIPRIITYHQLKEDPLQDILPETDSIQANLMIPIAIGGRNLLELNLDNISGDKIFDDMDIEIASHIASFMTASYELYMRQRDRDKNLSLIKQMRNMLETFSQSPRFYQKKAVSEIFIETLKSGLMVLHPKLIVFEGFMRQKGVNLLYREDDIPPNIIDRLTHIINEIKTLNRHCMSQGEGRYDLLVVKHEILPSQKYTAYIGLVRKDDVWTESDVHHVINTLSISALMASNIQHLEDMKATQEDTLKMLGKALEYRDLETKGHTERTGYLTLKLAQILNFKDIKGIMWGAYVHDVGKIAIPDYILLKPGKLSPEEFEIMKKHVIYGYNMLKGIRRIPKTTLNVVKYHHEKWNGTGYPEGLKGENIPLEARIFAVVDVFDALISKRPYKEKWPIHKALNIIRESSGKHFDPAVVEAFFNLVESTDVIDKLMDITSKAEE